METGATTDLPNTLPGIINYKTVIPKGIPT